MISLLIRPSVSMLHQLNWLITYRWLIVHAAHGSQRKVYANMPNVPGQCSFLRSDQLMPGENASKSCLSSWCGNGKLCRNATAGHSKVHSQEQSAHWAVDITAQVVPCWLSSWLKRNFWPVLRSLTGIYFPFTGLDITWVSTFRQ